MHLLKVLGVGSQSFDPQQVGPVSGVSTVDYISPLIFFPPVLCFFCSPLQRGCGVVQYCNHVRRPLIDRAFATNTVNLPQGTLSETSCPHSTKLFLVCAHYTVRYCDPSLLFCFLSTRLAE